MAQRKKPGSGGNNKRRLAGKGPTPKAEDRTYHPAAKRKGAGCRRRRCGGGCDELRWESLVLCQDPRLNPLERPAPKWH